MERGKTEGSQNQQLVHISVTEDYLPKERGTYFDVTVIIHIMQGSFPPFFNEQFNDGDVHFQLGKRRRSDCRHKGGCNLKGTKPGIFHSSCKTSQHGLTKLAFPHLGQWQS